MWTCFWNIQKKQKKNKIIIGKEKSFQVKLTLKEWKIKDVVIVKFIVNASSMPFR